MKFSSHGNGNGLNDLYILPETDKERELIKKFVKEKDIRSMNTFIGQADEWKGKVCFEIPFGEGWKNELQKYEIV
jgi:hypothetical protein